MNREQVRMISSRRAGKFRYSPRPGMRHRTGDRLAGGVSPTITAARSVAAAVSASASRARVDDRERLVGTDRVARPAHLREPDRGVDGVLDPVTAAAQRDHQETDRPGVHARDDAGPSGRDGASYRRRRQVSVGALDEVARPAERRDHAGEALGRGARGEGPLDGGGGRGRVARQAAEDEQLARERGRHGEEAGVPAAPGQEIDRLPTSSALPT